MDSSKWGYTSPKDNSMSLTDLSTEDRDLFAAALYRPLETWKEPRTLDEHSLLNDVKRKEKEKIRALPGYLLQKHARFHVALPNKPHPKGFCKTHDILHPYIIGSILHKVRHEVTGPQFNILVPLEHPVANSLACSLRKINGYWTTPHDHIKAFSMVPEESPFGSVFFQENGCDACILAAISGNTEVLEALRTSSFSKRRTGGRLVGWLDCWLAMRGPGVLHEVQRRSEKNAHTLRKLKSGNMSTNDKLKGGEGKRKDDAITLDNVSAGKYEGPIENSYWSSEISEDEDEVVRPRNANPKDVVDYFSGWV